MLYNKSNLNISIWIQIRRRIKFAGNGSRKKIEKSATNEIYEIPVKKRKMKKFNKVYFHSIFNILIPKSMQWFMITVYEN